MCHKCITTLKHDSSNLNPEPDQVALARHARLVESQELPRSLPAWLNSHLRANYVKPFEPDYRCALAHWGEPAKLEPSLEESARQIRNSRNGMLFETLAESRMLDYEYREAA
jgi:hypothetical protein